MNAGDDHTPDELASRLDRLATTIDLRTGSLDAVRTRGEQRIRRRRASIGSLSVVAVVSLSIAGVVVLSRPTDPTISNRAADDGTPSVSSDATATTTPNDTAAPDTAAPDTAILVAGVATTTAIGIGGAAEPAPALDLVDPAITWNVVRPDSTQALAYPAMYPGVLASGSPLYLYSSAPGRTSDGGGMPTLYRSDDGISWTPVDSATLPEHTATVGHLASTPAGVYALSTAPSAAAGEGASTPNGPSTLDTSGIVTGNGSDVVFSTLADDGTWASTVVPLDTAAWLDVPGVLGAFPSGLSASSIDGDGAGSIVVVASTSLQLDLSSLGVDPANAGIQVLPTGVDVTTYDESCMGVATTIGLGPNGATAATVPDTAVPDTAAPDTAAPDTAAPDIAVSGSTTIATEDTLPCQPTTEHHDLAELDVDQRALDEYFGPPHLFVSTEDGSFTEVAFPGTVPEGHTISGARLLTLGDQHALMYDEYVLPDYALAATHLWLSSDGQQWEERTLPATVMGSYSGMTLGRLADGRLAGVGSAVDEPWHLIAFVDDGAGGWTTTDLAGALRPDDGVSATLGMNAAIVDDTGITVAGMIMTDPIVEHGPVSTTDGDRTVSLVDSQGTYVLTDTATGEELARLDQSNGWQSNIRYEDDGSLVLLDDSGTELARISVEVQQRLNDLAYGGQTTPPSIVLHSADGASWSRESLHDIGSAGATWINWIGSVDGRVLGAFIDPTVLNDDGTPATFMLVGTPNG